MTTGCDECSEEYGPCELHCEVLFQREGASLRTSEELQVQFIDDCRALDPECLSVTGRIDLLRAKKSLARHASTVQVDLDLLVHQVESYLTDYAVYWDDGYRIVRITGGPLQEEP